MTACRLEGITTRAILVDNFCVVEYRGLVAVSTPHMKLLVTDLGKAEVECNVLDGALSFERLRDILLDFQSSRVRVLVSTTTTTTMTTITTSNTTMEVPAKQEITSTRKDNRRGMQAAAPPPMMMSPVMQMTADENF